MMVSSSPILRDILCFLSLVVFLTFAVSTAVFIRQRNRIWVIIGSGFLLLSFFLQQIFNVIISYNINGSQGKLAVLLGKIPALTYIVCVLFLLIVASYMITLCIKWDKEHVTPSSIKQSLDSLPSGVAIYDKDGRCLLVNRKMNYISECLTGQAVLNGYDMLNAAKKCNMLAEIEGEWYAFHQKELSYNNETIFELVCMVVTDLYNKAEQVRKGNEELVLLSQKLKKQGQTIDETVRKQEILQAKINIHDEMNRLLLVTGNVASNGASEEKLTEILQTWQNNALLLCMEGDENQKSNIIKDMETFAKLIGIEIHWYGKLSVQSVELLKIFGLITKEMMVNAVKHAGAKNLYVKMICGEKKLHLEYTNDGLKVKKSIQEGGGLGNVRQMIEKIGGTMQINLEDRFTLTAYLPLGGNVNDI